MILIVDAVVGDHKHRAIQPPQPASARRRRVDEVAIVALCEEAKRAIRAVSAAPEVGPSTRYAVSYTHLTLPTKRIV